MIIEMLFNNKIQIFSFELNLHSLKKNYWSMYIVEGNLWINFQFFYLNKLSIRYELLNFKFCVMFEWNIV
jgi:hypothetical protein